MRYYVLHEYFTNKEYICFTETYCWLIRGIALLGWVVIMPAPDKKQISFLEKQNRTEQKIQY